MAKKHEFGLQTKLIHAESRPCRCSSDVPNPHAEPIYRTTSWKFTSAEQIRKAFANEVKMDFYSRASNPNHRTLEKKLAILEGAEAVQTFNNGTMAIVVMLMKLLDAGDEIIAHKSLYGGTYQELKDLMRSSGKTVTFVDARNVENVLAAITPRTKLILIETPSNPTLDIIDFPRIKSRLLKMGREDILLAVDSTFATPYNLKPLLHGADLVIHSNTKYLNGFGVDLGGCIATSKAIYEKIWQRYTGFGCMNSEIAWQSSISLKTFCLRMERHNYNGACVASHLFYKDCVKKVYYPSLLDHPNHNVAARLMGPYAHDGLFRYGGMVSFEINGGTKEVEKFLNRLARDKERERGIITHCVSLGTVDTLVCCPALSTHYHVPKKERAIQGVSDTLIRLSVGIEDAEDIIDSLERGFEAI